MPVVRPVSPLQWQWSTDCTTKSHLRVGFVGFSDDPLPVFLPACVGPFHPPLGVFLGLEELLFFAEPNAPSLLKSQRPHAVAKGLRLRLELIVVSTEHMRKCRSRFSSSKYICMVQRGWKNIPYLALSSCCLSFSAIPLASCARLSSATSCRLGTNDTNQHERTSTNSTHQCINNQRNETKRNDTDWRRSGQQRVTRRPRKRGESRHEPERIGNQPINPARPGEGSFKNHEKMNRENRKSLSPSWARSKSTATTRTIWKGNVHQLERYHTLQATRLYSVPELRARA